MNRSIRVRENLHIVLWLAKDFAWIANFKVVGLIMGLPTLVLAFILVWLTRNQREDFFHNIAVACWITANLIWMVGEFFYNDGLRPISMPFFVAGLLVIGYYYGGQFFASKKKAR
jgi:hypothetical protein